VGAFYGSLVATILLLAAPTILLGFVTPFAIRLRIESLSSAGSTAGHLYALSTFGSILGSFLPVLVFIPGFGTRTTFFILAGLLLALSAVGLFELRPLRATAALPLAGVVAMLALLVPQQVKPAYRGVLIYETESEYNYIQVLQDGEETLLALNEGHAVHSIYNPNSLLTGGPWDYFALAPLFGSPAEPERTLMIGLAGGTAARQLLAAYPGTTIDGVEIDETVVEIAREYFAMTDPRIIVHIEDGRYFLRTTGERYDVIAIDAYRQPYIPFQLTTREFFTEAAERLNPCGVVAVNAGRTDTDYRLVDVLASTMRDVFPAVYAIDVERYDNTLLYGVTCPTTYEAIGARAATHPPESIVRHVAQAALLRGNPREIEPGGRVLADDHAPVETLIDLMIVDAARDEESR
jgi:spermidine synthase